MNVYDPAARIRYVHLAGIAIHAAGDADAGSRSVSDDHLSIPLPSGYANQSPRTRLQHRPGHIPAALDRAPRTA